MVREAPLKIFDNHLTIANVFMSKAIRGVVVNGRNIWFWVDPWLLDGPHRVAFAILYVEETKAWWLIRCFSCNVGDCFVLMFVVVCLILLTLCY